MFQVDIITKCKQNNRKAQLQLYNQYCNGMYIVAKRYMSSDAAAEDAVQDAFIKAFSKLHQYQAEVTFGAWLKRIVINTCIDALKRNKQELIALSDQHLKVVDSTDDKWLVDDDITIDRVKEAIATLAEKYRIVLTLFLIEGYDHQEISEILGISQTASRTQLSRGKQQLQKLLIPLRHGTRS